MSKTKWPYICLIFIVSVTAIFACMLPNIIMDNELRNFFPKSHNSYKKFNRLTEEFGDQYIMDVVLETSEDSILNKANYEIIKKITDACSSLDNVVNVKSIANIEFVTDDNGVLSTGKLIDENFCGTDKEIREVKRRILEWDTAYIGNIISSDFKGVQIVLTLNSKTTPDEAGLLYNQTVEILEKNIDGSGLIYRIAGDPVLGEYAKRFMYADLRNLIPLISIVVLICLFLSFKNFEGMLLPLIAVLISTIWTIGIMTIVHEPLTIVSSCLPVLLIAVGSAYGIHIINYYYQRLEKEPLITSIRRHQDLIVETVKSAKSPVLLAGITTIAGFVSTITSPIRPLKSFAIFSALGIIISLFLAFVFIPSILMLKPLKSIQKQQKRINSMAEKMQAGLSSLGIVKNENLLDKIYYYFNRRQPAFIVMLLIIISVSIWGITNLNIESAFLEYFPKHSQIRKDVTHIDEHYVGTTGFSFVVSGKEKGDICNPEILKQMDNLEIFLKSKHPEIGTILSITEFIKRMNQVMHAGVFNEDNTSGNNTVENKSSENVDSFFDDEEIEEPDEYISEKADLFAQYKNRQLTSDETVELFISAYASVTDGNFTVKEFLEALKKELNYKGAAYNEIPYDISKYPVSEKEELKNIISQYLLLYSGSLDALLDENLEPRKSRMQVIMRSHDTGKIKEVIDDALRFSEKHFPKEYTLEAAGLGELEVQMTSMIISSQITSLILAVTIVFCILSVFYRSVIAGLIGSIPLGVSILLNFGIMSLTGINLDMVTSLVAAIAIGIGIDYTVHFMNNYYHERINNSNLTQVTLNTLRNSGKGIAANAFAVGCGFLVMCFSKFVVLRFVGFLVAVVMFTGSTAALTILPVVLNIFKPKFMTKKHKSGIVL